MPPVASLALKEERGPSTSRVCANAPASRHASLPPFFAAFVAFVTCLSFVYIYSGCCMPRWLPIRADGFGYYAYLPAAFIDHDLSMKTPLANRRSVIGRDPVFSDWNGIAAYKPTGRVLDKYTLGTALLQAPFFLAAHLYAEVRNLAPYSEPYQLASMLSALAFLVAGSWLLMRLLLRHFPPLASILAAGAAIFGTSLFNNAAFLTSYSHAYSFFLFVLLLMLSDKYRARAAHTGEPLTLYCAGLGAVVGLIALVRVPNLIGCIIALAMVTERFWKSGNRRVLGVEASAGILAFVAVFSLQMAYWHVVTGHFFINSYQNEYFNWLEPKVLDFLFRIRSGLFVWSPLTLVAILGLPFVIARDKWLGIAISVVLALEIYICSSWWSWWFGSSFGSRPLSDMAALTALPFAALLERPKEKLARLLPIAPIAALICFNLFLMVSYWNQLYPVNDPTVANLALLPSKWENRHFLLPQLRKRLALSATYAIGTPFRADAGPPPGMWMEGFTERLAPASWTVAKLVSVYVHLPPRPPDLRLTLVFAPPGGLLTPGHPIQRGFALVDGSQTANLELKFGRDNRTRSFLIPRRLLRNVTRIDFRLPDAISPKSLGRNPDPRPLAFYISRLTLEPAPNQR